MFNKPNKKLILSFAMIMGLLVIFTFVAYSSHEFPGEPYRDDFKSPLIQEPSSDFILLDNAFSLPWLPLNLSILTGAHFPIAHSGSDERFSMKTALPYRGGPGRAGIGAALLLIGSTKSTGGRSRRARI